MKNQDQHCSHQHVLVSLQPEEGEEISCEACEELISEPFHGCPSCNFYLHDLCSEGPRSLDHPSHPSHPLTLLPQPTYPSGGYTCSACGLEGKAYGFSCAHCEFDLHVQCAYKPKTLQTLHPHELKLMFGTPYESKSISFSCDICSDIMDPTHWVYYCESCDFGAHLGCTSTSKTTTEVSHGEINKGINNINLSNDDGGRKNNYGVDEESGNNIPSSNANLPDSSRDQMEERAIFEAQRKLREERMAQQLFLEALDNGNDCWKTWF